MLNVQTVHAALGLMVVFGLQFPRPVNAQGNGVEFFDDFADGDVRDGDPVDWNSPTTNCHPLKQAVDGAVRLCKATNWDTDLAANRVFEGDVSVRTRARVIGTGVTGCVAHVRYNCFSNIWGYVAWVIPRELRNNPFVQADVGLTRADGDCCSVGAVLGRHDFPGGFDPREDHFLQLDVRGEFVELRVWRPDEPFPEDPLIRARDTTYRQGEAGIEFAGPRPSVIRNDECIDNYGEFDSVWIRDRMIGPDDHPPTGESGFLRGDCTGDGAVDITDASCALTWLFAGATTEPGCLAALNTNGDDGVDVADPITLLNFLFGGGPSISAPFPDCGPGVLPADEELGCESPPDDCR